MPDVTEEFFPEPQSTTSTVEEIKPRITVIGVGGGGGNAVANMISSKLEGVEFIVCNTDAQALSQSTCKNKIQIGMESTQGLGAGSKPEAGKAAAEESIEDIKRAIDGANMIFVAAGMGGGTGTGAAPVIAKASRELGILTVGVVTKPFQFEGIHRMRSAEKGIEELQQNVDTLIVIPNQNLFRVANEKTTFADAFLMADDVLHAGVRSVTDLMIMPGLINLDFADVRTVMTEMGKAMMGTGEAEGENRAIAAAEAAISNPLLDDVSMRGAKGILISITGGEDLTLYEVDEAANRVREEVDADANIIFGSTFDTRLKGKIRVSVVATGIEAGFVMQKAPEAEAELVQKNEEASMDLPQEPLFTEGVDLEPQSVTFDEEGHETPIQATLEPTNVVELNTPPVAPQAPERAQKKGFFSRIFGGSKKEEPASVPQPEAPVYDWQKELRATSQELNLVGHNPLDQMDEKVADLSAKAQEKKETPSLNIDPFEDDEEFDIPDFGNQRSAK